MQDFKKQWEITKNWQLIFPIIGLFSSIYLGTKLSFKILNQNFILEIIVGILLGILIVKSCIFFINKLEKKWIVNQRWELIRIFLIFALTGSSSVFVGRPFIKLLGVSKDNLHISVYYALFILISLVFYQILLLLWGWILGQFDFFWRFEKKMLKRLGLKKFIEDK
ncbi:MAG: DUF6787 family protein [Flavobacteriaceae bacterium]